MFDTQIDTLAERHPLSAALRRDIEALLCEVSAVPRHSIIRELLGAVDSVSLSGSWAEEAPPDDRPPAAESGPASRYEDLGRIGSGGMGEVRRVRDPNLNRTLAMKVLRAGVAQRNPKVLQRFVEEAQVTAQLQHPGIVAVHELGRLPSGQPYFTMAEVRGRTLGAVIAEVHAAAKGGRSEPGATGWSFRRLVATFHHVCNAVAYAHGRGVVHRDLKPSNVMVGEHGEVLRTGSGDGLGLGQGAGPGGPRRRGRRLGSGGDGAVRRPVPGDADGAGRGDAGVHAPGAGARRGRPHRRAE